MASTGTMKDYATKFANSSESSERMVSLWRQGLAPEDAGRGKLAWYYVGNPEGWPIVAFLLHGEARETVGVTATGTRSMRCGAHQLRAGLMVDFVVVEAHRTLFPAIHLQKAICRRALESHDVLYGIPNPKSLAAVRRAGYRQVGMLVRRVRVLRSAPYLARHLPALPSRVAGAIIDGVRLLGIALRRLRGAGFRTAWVDHPDARFDDLWSRTGDDGTLMGVRDRRFLHWRFVDFPGRRHRFFTVVSDADGRLAGYAACNSESRVLKVRDFLVDPALPGAWERLWSDLALAAFREGHDSLCVEFMGAAPLQRRLTSKGMLARAERPVYAVLPKGREAFADESRWYMTNADEDT